MLIYNIYYKITLEFYEFQYRNEISLILTLFFCNQRSKNTIYIENTKTEMFIWFRNKAVCVTIRITYR